jgi:hypothetical protein
MNFHIPPALSLIITRQQTVVKPVLHAITRFEQGTEKTTVAGKTFFGP